MNIDDLSVDPKYPARGSFVFRLWRVFCVHVALSSARRELGV